MAYDTRFFNQFQDSILVDSSGETVIQIDDTTLTAQYNVLPAQTITDFAIYSEVPKWHFFNGITDWKYAVVNKMDDLGRVTGTTIVDAHDPSSTSVNVGNISNNIVFVDSAKHSLKNVMTTTRFAHFRQCTKFFIYSFKVGNPINVPLFDVNGNPLLDASSVQYNRLSQLYGVYLDRNSGEALPYWTNTDPDSFVYYYADNNWLGGVLSTVADGSGVTITVDGSANPLNVVLPPHPDFTKRTMTSNTSTAYMNNLCNGTTFELPPAGMTADTSVIGVNNLLLDGQYTARASSFTVGYEAYRAFSKTNVNQWQSVNSSGAWYAAPTAVGYSGTIATAGISGDWIQILLPRAVYLRSYVIRPVATLASNIGPASVSVLGSTNGTAWTLLDASSGLTWSSSGEVTFNVASINPTAFNYYRFVFTSMYGSARAMVGEVAIVDGFGARYPGSGLTSNSTTFVDGLYTVSASSTDSSFNDVYMAFDQNANSFWMSASGSYAWSGASWSGITAAGADLNANFTKDISQGTSVVVYSGEWVQLFTPTPMTVTSYTVQASGTLCAPVDFTLHGSYNANEWYLLDSRTGITSWSASGLPQTFAVTNKTAGNGDIPFNWYRLTVTRVNSGRTVVISDIKLYGRSTYFPAIRYPPMPMTASSVVLNTTNSLTSGTYNVKSSSTYNNGIGSVNNAFKYEYAQPITNNTNLVYTTDYYLYNRTIYRGSVITIDASTNIGYSGAWVSIKCPSGNRLQSYNVPTGVLDGPRQFSLLGSSDDVNFRLINTTTYTAADVYAGGRTISLSGQPVYTTYRLVLHEGVCNTQVTLEGFKLTDISGTVHPSGNLTSNSSLGYTVTSSDASGWWVFDGSAGTAWRSASNYEAGYYYGSNTTVAGGVTYSGEWVQIQLPTRIQLSQYIWQGRAGPVGWPTDYVLLGSNDETTWTLVDSKTGYLQATGSSMLNWPAGGGTYTTQKDNQIRLTSTPGSFSYYRIVFMRTMPVTQSFNGFVAFYNLALYGTPTDRAMPNNVLLWSPPAYYSSANTSYNATMRHMNTDPNRVLLLYYDVNPTTDKQFQGDELYAVWSSRDIGTTTASGFTYGPVKDLDPLSATYQTDLITQNNRFVMLQTLPAFTTRNIRIGLRSQTLNNAAPRLNFPISSYNVLQRLNIADASFTMKTIPFAYEVPNRNTFSADIRRSMMGGRLLQLLSHYLYNNVSDDQLSSFPNYLTEASRLTDTFLDSISTRLQQTSNSASLRRTDFLNQLLYRYGRQYFDEYATFSTASGNASVGNVREVIRALDDVFVNFAMSVETRVSNRSKTGSDAIRFYQIPVVLRLTSSIFSDGTSPFIDFDANYVTQTTVAASGSLVSAWPNIAFPSAYTSYGTIYQADASAASIAGSGPVLRQVTGIDGTSVPAVSFTRSSGANFVISSPVNFNNILSTTGFTCVTVASFTTAAGSVSSALGESIFSFSLGLPTPRVIRLGRDTATATTLMGGFQNSNESPGNNVTLANGITPNARSVFALVFTPTGNGTSTTASMYVDGSLNAIVTGLPAMTNRTTTQNYIGRGLPGVAGSFFDGFIHSLQMYPRALTGPEVARLNTYLRYRWRIS